MYVKNQNLGIFGLPGIGSVTAAATKAAATATKSSGSGGGFWSGLDNLLTSAQKAAETAVNTKLQLQQIKSIGQSQPYAMNVATPSQPVVIQSAPTSERFIPQTTQVSTTKGGMTATSPDPLTPDEIATIQRTLNAKGFDAGPVDGLYGPKTAAGIRNFQQANNLPATGIVTYDLLRRLTAPVSTSNPTAISGNPSASPYTSAPQSPTKIGAGAVPYYSPQPQIVQVPAPAQAGFSGMAVPLAIGGAGLALALIMGRK